MVSTPKKLENGLMVGLWHWVHHRDVLVADQPAMSGSISERFGQDSKDV